jgi:hypothetical protein
VHAAKQLNGLYLHLILSLALRQVKWRHVDFEEGTQALRHSGTEFFA